MGWTDSDLSGGGSAPARPAPGRRTAPPACAALHAGWTASTPGRPGPPWPRPGRRPACATRTSRAIRAGGARGGAGGTDSGRDRMRAAMAVQTCSGGACGGRARASGSAVLPSRAPAGAARRPRAAGLRTGVARPRAHAGHVIRGQAVLQIGVAVVHSMHLLSRCRPRRIQLFTVPSGASRRAAMSDAPGRRRTPSRWRRAAGRPARPCSRPGGCLPGWPPGGPAGQGVVGEASVSASSGSGSSRPGRRRRSMQRLRTMRVIQVMGWLWSGRYCPACRQIERKHSCSTSSAAAGSLNIRLASAYRCGDARRYSSSSADSRWRALREQGLQRLGVGHRIPGTG